MLGVELHAQVQIPYAPGSFPLGNRPELQGGSRDVIWFEDFANGIPSDWTSTETSGIASWEYRGPNTTPGVDVGSRGSCVAPGTVGQPIVSPSAANGFVIFDSNWWDNPSSLAVPTILGQALRQLLIWLH